MTKQTKHTPGPWYKVWEETPEGDYPIEEEKTNRVIGWIKGKENAQLVAASPDLLAALERCAGGLDAIMSTNIKHDGLNMDGVKRAYEKAMAAIAKAKGE